MSEHRTQLEQLAHVVVTATRETVAEELYASTDRIVEAISASTEELQLSLDRLIAAVERFEDRVTGH